MEEGKEKRREELVALHKQDKWHEILEIYSKDAGDHLMEAWDCSLLWLHPSEMAMQFIRDHMHKMGLKKILSIGCGSGLLEWIIQRATGLHVEGVEVDNLWWNSIYAPPCFLPENQRHIITNEEDFNGSIPEEFALLFCYFNNEHAFQSYINRYMGNCLLIAGPAGMDDSFPPKGLIECEEIQLARGGRHCNPKPFEIKEPWTLIKAHAVTTSPGDYIAIYTK